LSKTKSHFSFSRCQERWVRAPRAAGRARLLRSDARRRVDATFDNPLGGLNLHHLEWEAPFAEPRSPLGEQLSNLGPYVIDGVQERVTLASLPRLGTIGRPLSAVARSRARWRRSRRLERAWTGAPVIDPVVGSIQRASPQHCHRPFLRVAVANWPPSRRELRIKGFRRTPTATSRSPRKFACLYALL
jgi:hypothetical protein